MNIKPFLTAILTFCVISSYFSTSFAQPTCESPVLDEPNQFSGVILSFVPADGVRALRPELATTYYIAFDGGNFTAGGSVSPDGRYYAVPNGVIQTNNSADIRHVVQEIRIITTETVPRIAARIPWQASFPVGTRFATTQGIPSILWLDAQTVAFPSGSMNGEQLWQRVDFSTSPADIQPFEVEPFVPEAPDGSRGFKPDSLGWGIYDLATQTFVGRLPRLSAAQTIVWSPDSSRLAAIINQPNSTQLVLFWRGGAEAEQVIETEMGRAIWNVRWSPDGKQLAYGLYDPEANLSRLYLYQVETGVSVDTCLDLLPHPQAVVWSEDGSHLAVLSHTTGEESLFSFDPTSNTLSYLSPYTGGLLGWFE